jgi:hypothetical protein
LTGATKERKLVRMFGPILAIGGSFVVALYTSDTGKEFCWKFPAYLVFCGVVTFLATVISSV